MPSPLSNGHLTSPNQPVAAASPTRGTPGFRDSRSIRTGDRIMIAAERLFGDFGLEAVSMRQVMTAAGVSNKSAVSYHFGNRADLIRQILRHRLPGLERRRHDLLDALIAAGGAGDPHSLARVLVMPAYELVDEDGRHRYATFLRQVLRSNLGLDMRGELIGLSPTSMRAYEMFRALFGHVPSELFVWRTRAAAGLFFDLVFDRDRALAANAPGSMDEDTFLAEAIKMMVACCAA